MPDPFSTPSAQTIPVSTFLHSVASGNQPEQNADTFSLTGTPPAIADFRPAHFSASQIAYMRQSMRGVLATGGSQEDAVRVMELEGQSTANLAPSLRPLEPTKHPEIAEAEEIGMINGLGRRVIQGISFGFGDEALGSILGIISGQGARGGIEQYRAELETWNKNHKIT